MKIPKEIKLGGHTIRVIMVDEIDGGDSWGRYHEKRGEIRVMSGIHESVTEQAFLHEAIHAIDSIFNADNLDDNTVERLSQGLYQLIKQL